MYLSHITLIPFSKFGFITLLTWKFLSASYKNSSAFGGNLSSVSDSKISLIFFPVFVPPGSLVNMDFLPVLFRYSYSLFA